MNLYIFIIFVATVRVQKCTRGSACGRVFPNPAGLLAGLFSRNQHPHPRVPSLGATGTGPALGYILNLFWFCRFEKWAITQLLDCVLLCIRSDMAKHTLTRGFRLVGAVNALRSVWGWFSACIARAQVLMREKEMGSYS